MLRRTGSVLPVLILAGLAFAGCVDDLGPKADLSLAGKSKVVDGVYLFDEPMIEARFATPGVAAQDWADSAQVTIDLAKMTLNKRPAEATGGDGETHQLVFSTNTTLEVRLKEPIKFQGYRIAWAIRIGNPEGGNWWDAYDWSWFQQPKEECQNINLNGRQFGPPEETHVFPLYNPGVFAVQVEVLDGKERVAMLCTPITAFVNAHWQVDSQITPVGVDWDYVTNGPARDAQNYAKQADEFPVDVGTAFVKLSGKSYRGKLHATLSYRGTWSPEKGDTADLQYLVPGDQWGDRWQPCLSNIWDPSPSIPQGPGHFTNQEIDATVIRNGIWILRVGGGYSCSILVPKTYANMGPVPYSLDVKLTYS